MKPHPGLWKDATWYEVAVYWPEAGEADPYGGRTVCKTLADAEREAERTRALGYKHVHIRKVVVEAVTV